MYCRVLACDWRPNSMELAMLSLDESITAQSGAALSLLLAMREAAAHSRWRGTVVVGKGEAPRSGSAMSSLMTAQQPTTSPRRLLGIGHMCRCSLLRRLVANGFACWRA
uniref:Uncharacterized protein n=1 Tax=Tetraselmis chuii TaxID=63592 RepID=A0A7S1SMC5_9CHLO